MDKSNKGQASIEILVGLGIVLMILIIMGQLVYRSYAKSNDLKVYIFGARLANNVADDINVVNAVGEGYSTRILLPPSLFGSRNYTVNFFKNESFVFVEGSSFSTGDTLTYSSPISTGRVHCLLKGCSSGCNRTSSQECLPVNDGMSFRVVKYAGETYLTEDYNVVSEGISSFAVPFSGETDQDPMNPPGYVRQAGDPWNVIYVFRNLGDDSLSLVFSMNLTNGEKARMTLDELRGNVVWVKSNDAPPQPEFNLDAQPQAMWTTENQPEDVDGGAIKFSGGFHVCVIPTESLMPTQDWIMLSADGNNIVLDKSERVCITYP